MWNRIITSEELTHAKGHRAEQAPETVEVNQAVAPYVTRRPIARDRLDNLRHRIGVGETIAGVHEPQQIPRRVANALVHGVVSSAVGLGLPIREPRLAPGQIFHDAIARTTVDHDVLDTSPVALRSDTVHCALQPVKVVQGNRYHRDGRS